MGEKQKKANINKKIIVLILAILIIVNHFIAPIIQFAEEPQESLAEINDILIEEENNIIIESNDSENEQEIKDSKNEQEIDDSENEQEINDSKSEEIVTDIKSEQEEIVKPQYAYFRNNHDSKNGPLYYINKDYKNKIKGSFARNIDLSEEQVINLGAVRLDKDYEKQDAEGKIYGWIDENGNCWWWSNAQTAVISDKSNAMFKGMGEIKSITIANIDTSEVTDMTDMFFDCVNLAKLDISNLNTSNVTNMTYMFGYCKSLTSLDLSNFNTSNVKSMEAMFGECSSLKELKISKFNTEKVTNMSSVFYGCSKLTNLDLSNFNTNNVTNMKGLFYNCSSLTKLNLTTFDTRNVTDMSFMFRGCESLTELDLSKFNTSKVINMASMFYGCKSVTELDLSKFDTSNVKDMNYMFGKGLKLKRIYASEKFVTKNVENSSSMFSDCTVLVGGNGTKFNASYEDKTYACIDKAGQVGYFTLK